MVSMANDHRQQTSAAAAAAAGASHVHGPLPVSRSRQVCQQTNSPQNQQTSDSTSNKTSTANETNKKSIVRLTNKQRIESKLLHLTSDVNALQEELRSLQTFRTILQARELLKPQAADGSIVHTAQQYLHVFRRGYRVTDAVAQFAFLQAVTDDALSMGTTGLGRSMLFEQWPATPDADETCIVQCESTLHGSFTWQALEIVFPAVKWDPQHMQQLLGREMVTPMCFHLHFDRQGYMVRHDFEADFFAALVHALKDPVRAAEIIGDAKVAEEGMVDAIDEMRGSRDAVVTMARGKKQRRRRDDGDQELREPDVAIEDERLSVTYMLSESRAW